MANISAEIHMRDGSCCTATLFGPKLGNSELTFVTVKVGSEPDAVTDRAIFYFNSADQIDSLLNALVDARQLLTGRQLVVIARPASAQPECI